MKSNQCDLLLNKTMCCPLLGVDAPDRRNQRDKKLTKNENKKGRKRERKKESGMKFYSQGLKINCCMKVFTFIYIVRRGEEVRFSKPKTFLRTAPCVESGD